MDWGLLSQKGKEIIEKETNIELRMEARNNRGPEEKK